MSSIENQLDLSQLAVNRGQSATLAARARRPWFTRYVIPGAILLGFVGLFVWSAQDSFLPTQAVTVTPVIVSRAEIKQEGTPLFQAAGWVEPRPTPVIASSLATGVIQDLLVIEGQHVKKGEAIARLIETDAKLSLADAESKLATQRGELQRANATLTAAQINLEKPISLQASLAEADAFLAAVEREVTNLPFARDAATTSLELARSNLESKRKAGDAITGRVLREATAEVATAENKYNELAAREPSLLQQADSLRRRQAALAEQLALLSGEKQAVSEAEANVAIMTARVEQAKLAVDVCELQLERMTVRSPIDGCVLSVEARPGQWLAGVGANQQSSSAVARLYDPKSLQVRVDVRLEDVPQVQIGQPAQIESAAISGAIAGQVISVTTQADIQKNTLQVKVAILDPPAVIKPEMLAKATFIAPPSPVELAETSQSPLRLFVPQSLVTSGDGGASVWVVDLASSTAKQQTIETGSGNTAEGLVEVTAGLTPTDKLIVGGRESLSDGARIRITGEDTSLAVRSTNASTLLTANRAAP